MGLVHDLQVAEEVLEASERLGAGGARIGRRGRGGAAGGLDLLDLAGDLGEIDLDGLGAGLNCL